MQEVRVPTALVRADVDEDDERAGDEQTAREQFGFQPIDVALGRMNGMTPQRSASVPAIPAFGVAARIGAEGRNADRSRAVFPSWVTATIASACPVVASVTAASASDAECRLPVGSIDRPYVRGWQNGFGIADDGVQHLHGADRKCAGRCLAGEHDRVGPLVHGVGRVADLRTRRPGVECASTPEPAWPGWQACRARAPRG